jgi:hypothetical protein
VSKTSRVPTLSFVVPCPCGNRVTTYNGVMNTIRLTDAELEMARHALRAYSLAFGHDEADTLAEIHRVIAKLRAAEVEAEEPSFTA